ncbi:hypothetical protein ACWF82_15150 [Nocardia sp. NPDC055053]
MSINRTNGPAATLKRAVTNNRPNPTARVELDDFSDGVARRMVGRRIVQAAEDTTEPDKWLIVRNLAEQKRREVAAGQKPEEPAPQSTADLIRSTMAETYRPASRADMPLNGDAVIRAAGGDPSAQSSWGRESVAMLIRRGLMTTVQDGRSE